MVFWLPDGRQVHVCLKTELIQSKMLMVAGSYNLVIRGRRTRARVSYQSLVKESSTLVLNILILCVFHGGVTTCAVQHHLEVVKMQLQLSHHSVGSEWRLLARMYFSLSVQMGSVLLSDCQGGEAEAPGGGAQAAGGPFRVHRQWLCLHEEAGGGDAGHQRWGAAVHSHGFIFSFLQSGPSLWISSCWSATPGIPPSPTTMELIL